MALGTRLIIILLGISVVLTLAGYNLTDDYASTMGIEYNQTTRDVDFDEDVAGAGIETESEQSGIIAGVTNFFDRYINIGSWVSKIFTFLAGPIPILNNLDAPKEIVYLVGAIWIGLWTTAIASFIWRKDI